MKPIYCFKDSSDKVCESDTKAYKEPIQFPYLASTEQFDWPKHIIIKQ